ncbi:MAG TPA: ATP-dependent DNA helicase PcrA [Spirochaetes bacterium]|nr:ATP-dependent DNA helicase PcrA [Spirochaetota bacterium]
MSPAIPYEQHLNPAQLEAVFYNKSPLLVLAGAGSGKTRVITYKIAYLINECGVKPGNILAVTFTNKASSEMNRRVQALVGENIEIWVKTFHSTAARLLRTMGSHFGIDAGFTIIDQQDQKVMVRKIIKDINLDTETYKPEKYTYLIERAKDRLLDPDTAYSESFSTDPYFFDIYRVYEEKLKNENLMDFGDLIYRLTLGLSQNNNALALLRKRFRYILVDEFQDTNHAQYSLVKKLTLPDGNICVVGDDDQSIYGFRGARIENILNFSSDYSNTKTIKLEENYRSYQTILTASSGLIDRNPDRLGKTLYTNKGDGEKLEFYRASSDYNEASYIAGQINRLTGFDNYSYSDIAVFYRMNAQSRVFESVFSQMRIPFTVVGSLRFYAREEIKDIISYIRLVLNPRDEIALRRIANKPPRGIGPKTIDAIVNATIEKGYPFYQDGVELEIPPSRVPLVKNFLKFFIKLKDMVDKTHPLQLLKYVFSQTGYLEWLIAEKKEQKVKNLDELYNAVEEFSKSNTGAPISEFVEEVSLNQAGPEDEEYKNNSVFLITLHNAKGLEFPVVFMAGMEEGLFPHFLSGERLGDLEEERRLCYVGMTRAMEKLFLTAAENRRIYGRKIQSDVSKFIHEIPGEIIIMKEEKDFNHSGPLIDNQSLPVGHRVNRGRLEKAQPGFYRKNAAAAKKEIKVPDIYVNCRIVHDKFGGGKVLDLEKESALIKFDNGTTMKLMLQYAPITKEKDSC